MELNADFADLIKFLTAQNVEFLIVGAHALAFHGVARYTQDLDVWVKRSADNAKHIQEALSGYGIELPTAAANELTLERKFIRLGREPVRIDILNFLDGCEFEASYERAALDSLDGTPVRVLSLEDYVATKIASGRPKDLSDIALLRSAIGRLPGD